MTNTLTFTPGIMTVDWQVPIMNSPTQYGDLSVALEMSGVSNAIISSPGSATLIISSVNNAPGVLAFAQTTYEVSEGGTNAAITIIRTNGTEGTVSATLTTSNGTAVAGVNYTGITNSVTFDASVTAQTVLIPVDQQQIAGPNVTLSMTLSNPQNGASIGSPSQATLTIDNNLENFSFGQVELLRERKRGHGIHLDSAQRPDQCQRICVLYDVFAAQRQRHQWLRGARRGLCPGFGHADIWARSIRANHSHQHHSRKLAQRS